MGEDGRAHEGLLRVRSDVDQLGDVVRHRGEQRQPVGWDGRHLELEREVGHHRGQVGISGTLAVAVDAPLHVGGAHRHPGQRVRHRAPAVVVEVHADLGLEAVDDAADDALDLVGQRASVRVAQHQRLGTGLLGGLQDAEGEPGVGLVAVEEVLGVEEHPQVVGPQECHRVRHHGHGLVEGRAQGVDHVHLRGLGHDAHGLGTGLDEMAERIVVLGPHTGTTGRTEGHQRGPGEGELLRRTGEELGVLRVGPRPAALDERDPEVVELLRHPELVVDGQGQSLLLRPVPQGGVEDVHCVGQIGQRRSRGPSP